MTFLFRPVKRRPLYWRPYKELTVSFTAETSLANNSNLLCIETFLFCTVVKKAPPGPPTKAKGYWKPHRRLLWSLERCLVPLMVPICYLLRLFCFVQTVEYFKSLEIVCYLLRPFCFCTVVKKAPPVPPSKAQAIILEAVQREDYFGSLRRLFKHQGFILLMITYGK